MIILLFIGILYQFMFFPFQYFADGATRHHFIQQLMNHGVVEPMKYSLIGPLLSYPFAFIDKVFAVNFWQLRYNFFLLCLASYILYGLLRNIVEKQLLLVFITLLFFGSMFPGHIIHFYGEVFSALLMTVGIVLIERNKTLIGWACMVLSVGNTPATFIPLILLCAYKIIRERKISYILLPIATFIVLLGDSKLRMPKTSAGFLNYLYEDKGFETILPYSGRPGFSYSMILGILGELLSFGKGLLFFAPGILFIIHVWRKIKNNIIKNILLLWTIYLIGLILVYSKWWAWYGGWFWGPRFLLFASIPSSFCLAYILTNSNTKVKLKLVALFLTLWSLWVGINGVLFQQYGLDICTKNNYALEHLCWYVPEFSVLFHPFVKIPSINALDWFLVFISFSIWIILVYKSHLTANQRHKHNLRNYSLG